MASTQTPDVTQSTPIPTDDGASHAPPVDVAPTRLPAQPPDNAPLGARLRYWVWKYIGTLVMEPTATGEYVMSLGRFSTAALLAQAMLQWAWHNDDLPDSMTQTLWILLAYNLGTKVTTTVQTLVAARGEMHERIATAQRPAPPMGQPAQPGPPPGAPPRAAQNRPLL